MWASPSLMTITTEKLLRNLVAVLFPQLLNDSFF